MIELTSEQVEDAEKMASGYDIPNFSKAGTGKTHTALEAYKRTDFKRGLILCPKIALDWWGSQVEEYLGRDCQVIRSSKELHKADTLIMTYNVARLMHGYLYELFGSGGDAVLINDESHYICSPKAKMTQTIVGKRLDLRGGLAEQFQQVWNLTGTPQVNYSNDLYTQIAVLHPEVFAEVGVKSYEQFERKFCYKQKRQYHPNMQPVMKVVGNSNEGVLHKLIYKDIGAVRRLEAPGLPGLLEKDLYVDWKLDAEHRKMFSDLKGLSHGQLIDQLNDPDSPAGRAWRITGLTKVHEVVPYVGDSVKDSPVLLGCWHRDVMNMYETELKKHKLTVVQVHGSTTDKAKTEARDQFNKGHIDVLIGQMRAMGVSWNIQEACKHVIIAEQHPTPGVVEQFYKRVYRRGQKSNVQVDNIYGRNNPLDKALADVRARKSKSIEVTHQ